MILIIPAVLILGYYFYSLYLEIDRDFHGPGTLAHTLPDARRCTRTRTSRAGCHLASSLGAQAINLRSALRAPASSCFSRSGAV